MRLLNTRTLQIESFMGDDVPRYAILSHTWDGENEVSFQEWQQEHARVEKSGYWKIMSACGKATEGAIDYIWVDTNCIDKTSSAELSEAINSMFAWYENAAICFAYLADVHGTEMLFGQSPEGYAAEESFHQSRWFTRGWTLQELLAPRSIIFYNASWEQIGSKSSLKYRISDITGIDQTYLSRTDRIWSASVAARMSWLSTRVTTRVEDLAYCMLGIFDINMPLLYGEGAKAFLRLQEEIIKISDDQTVFCWEWDSTLVPDNWQSILAPNPRVFANSVDYVSTPRHQSSEVMSYGMTNAGLRIELPVIGSLNQICAVLDVTKKQDMDPQKRRRYCIPLAGDDGVHRRTQTPSQPLPLHSAMITTKKKLYIVSRTTRSQAHPWLPSPYIPHYSFGFHMNYKLDDPDASYHELSMQLLVGDSRPVYSVVGFQTILEDHTKSIVFQVTYRLRSWLVLIGVKLVGAKAVWFCHLLDSRDFLSGLAQNSQQEALNNSVKDLVVDQNNACGSGLLVVLDGVYHTQLCDHLRVVYIIVTVDEESQTRFKKSFSIPAGS
jgi:hypothetical protein